MSNATLAEVLAAAKARKGEGRGRSLTITSNDEKVLRVYARNLQTGDMVSAKAIARLTGVEEVKVSRAIGRATSEKKPSPLFQGLFVKLWNEEKVSLDEAKAKADAADKAKGKGK